MLSLVVAVLSGCFANTSGLRHINQIGFATSSALVLCDTASTVQMSDGGRWDRRMGGGMLREQNPVLGSSPSVPLLAGAAGAGLGINTALYHSGLPDWMKASWFGALIVIEGVVVANNARFAGVCGLGAQLGPPGDIARR